MGLRPWPRGRIRARTMPKVWAGCNTTPDLGADRGNRPQTARLRPKCRGPARVGESPALACGREPRRLWHSRSRCYMEAPTGIPSVRIRDILSDAQDGHAFANVARAFHLPAPKVEVAIAAMLDEIVAHVEKRMQNRRSLAGLIELLGQNGYEQVLETPVLLGATHTQVLGNDALKFITGRGTSDSLARQAAAHAGISEMISEYLLPVVAAMVVGALAKSSRRALERIMGTDDIGDGNPAEPVPNLPRVSGGVGFSGSTGGGIVAGTAASHGAYLELAEAVRRAEQNPGASDPAPAVRRALAASLGGASAAAGWIDRLRVHGVKALNAAIAAWRR
jgi:hypothetical protein